VTFAPLCMSQIFRGQIRAVPVTAYSYRILTACLQLVNLLEILCDFRHSLQTTFVKIGHDRFLRRPSQNSLQEATKTVLSTCCQCTL